MVTFLFFSLSDVTRRGRDKLTQDGRWKAGEENEEKGRKGKEARISLPGHLVCQRHLGNYVRQPFVLRRGVYRCRPLPFLVTHSDAAPSLRHTSSSTSAAQQKGKVMFSYVSSMRRPFDVA